MADNLIQESVPCQSLIVSSGSTSALTVAFNDLKRRYLQRQSDISYLKNQNLKVSMELHQKQNENQILERKIEQLQKNLESKTTQLHNLEATFSKTRENEDSLIRHSAETDKLLEDAMHKLKIREQESEQLIKEITWTKQSLLDLSEQNILLEKEVEDLKQVPEVSVLKDDNNKSSKNIPPIPPRCLKSYDDFHTGNDNRFKELEKRYQSVLLENKNLRTTVHWLDKGLKEAKEDGFSKRSHRIRRDSDSLEEGKKQSSNVQQKTENNIYSYIGKLHDTILILQKSLESNNITLNKLLQRKSGIRETSCSSAQQKMSSILSRKSKPSSKDSEIYDFEETKPTQLYAKGLNCDSLVLQKDNNAVPNVHDQPLFEKVEKHKLLYPSMWKPSSTFEHVNFVDLDSLKTVAQNTPTMHDLLDFKGEINLPPSLIQNVRLQQTQTYLKSKTLLPRIPSIYFQEIRSPSTGSVTPTHVDSCQVNTVNMMERPQIGNIKSVIQNAHCEGQLESNLCNLSENADPSATQYTPLHDIVATDRLVPSQSEEDANDDIGSFYNSCENRIKRTSFASHDDEFEC